MIRRLLPLLTGWALFALATPAAAQSPLAFRGFGTIAVEQQAAKDSFDAVTGSTTLTSFGAGVQVTNIWRRLFVEIGAERASLDGERVFVDGSTVERLGIPVEITVAPLDVTPILESVAKTSRLCIAHEAVVPFGIGAEIAAVVAREAFWDLDAPIERIGAAATPPPYAPDLERAWLPDRTTITDTLRRLAQV